MNSKQGSRYIKRRMGNDLKLKILEYNGVASSDELHKNPSIPLCPRCGIINAFDNKYCSECSYPLVPEAYDEIKQKEQIRINKLEEEIRSLKQSDKEIRECLKHPEKLARIALEN